MITKKCDWIDEPGETRKPEVLEGELGGKC
jgi:hypothetical protein